MPVTWHVSYAGWLNGLSPRYPHWPQQKAACTCRPTLQLDACHLTGEFKGVVLTASAMDGYGNWIPIAHYTCPKENTLNYRTLFKGMKMHPDLADWLSNPAMVIFSDRARCITLAIAIEAPHAFQRLVARPP